MSQQLHSTASPGRQRLVRLMQIINFGRIEQLVVRDGEPAFDPAPRVLRTIKFAAATGARAEVGVPDFLVKREVLDLFQQFDAVRDGVILLIDVRHGLPLLMEIEEVVSVSSL